MVVIRGLGLPARIIVIARSNHGIRLPACWPARPHYASARVSSP